MRLTKEVKELEFFGKNEGSKTYTPANNDLMRSPKPFKVMDEPLSESDEPPELQVMTSKDWERVEKMKKEILSQLSKSVEEFTDEESSKSKSFIKEEVLNRFNQLSEILIKEIKTSMDTNA
jgi:hypothetical protein